MTQSQEAAAGSESRAWWGAGSAPHRPNVGSTPSVGYGRSYARSRVLPGLMVICGGLAMVMSTQAWITAHFLQHASSVDGTDKVVSTAFGVNGWMTFALGAALVALCAVMMASDQRGIRVLTALVATGLLAGSGYELIRVLQKIHYAHSVSSRMGSLAYELLGRAHVGYALIVLTAAAGAAFIASLIELTGE